jgi:hypothetical protein
LYGHYARGQTSFYMGNFPAARKHLDTAISLYDCGRHGSLAYHFGGVDAGVWCPSYAAWALWYLGYPDQALKKGNEVTFASFLSSLCRTVFRRFSSISPRRYYNPSDCGACNGALCRARLCFLARLFDWVVWWCACRARTPSTKDRTDIESSVRHPGGRCRPRGALFFA